MPTRLRAQRNDRGFEATAVATMTIGSLGLLSVVLAGCTISAAAEPVGVAVVELFTSEGCSSCPPADRVLQRVAAAQQKSGSRVYCIGWHVDYWDRLGWPDRFADRRFTQRQQAYARQLELNAVYTPQAVVNGTHEFVGSNAGLMSQSIELALGTPVRHRLELKLHPKPGRGVADVEFHVTPAAAGLDLQLVLVESDHKSDVAAGENRGATLTHTNVARAWTTVRLSQQTDGTATLDLPEDIRTSSARILGFVQSPRSLAIIGAADAGWPNASR